MLIQLLEALIARLDQYCAEAKRIQDEGTHPPSAYWDGILYSAGWAADDLRDILEHHSHPDRLALAHLNRLLDLWVEGVEGCSYTADLYRDTPNLSSFWKGKARGHEYASVELAELIAYMKQRRNTL